MKKKHNCFIIFGVLIFLIFLSVGFNLKDNARRATNDEDSDILHPWIGEYVYDEFIPPNINMNYRIEIYKEKFAYLANIQLDGFQTSMNIVAKVRGNEKYVELLFDSALNGNLGNYKDGDILLSLDVFDGILKTRWKKMTCIEDGRYFQKMYTNYHGIWRITEIYPNMETIKSDFIIGSEFILTDNQLTYNNLSYEVLSTERQVIFPDFFTQRTEVGREINTITRGLLYNGNYLEAEITDITGKTIMYMYPIDDRESIIIDTNGIIYRADLIKMQGKES